MVWFCAKLRKMIMTKKPGPPVPPRPNIYVQTQLNANKSISQSSTLSTTTAATTTKTTMPHGRTVIYKSPSYDDKLKKVHPKQQHVNDEHNLLIYSCGNNNTNNNGKKIDQNRKDSNNKTNDDEDDHVVVDVAFQIEKNKSSTLTRNINKVTTPSPTPTTTSSTTCLLKNGAITTISSSLSSNGNAVNDDDNSNSSTKCIDNRTEIIIVNNDNKSTVNCANANDNLINNNVIVLNNGSSSINNNDCNRNTATLLQQQSNVVQMNNKDSISIGINDTKIIELPVAKPRQNAPSRKLRKSQENIIITSSTIDQQQQQPTKHIIEINSSNESYQTMANNNQIDCNQINEVTTALDTLSSSSSSLSARLPLIGTQSIIKPVAITSINEHNQQQQLNENDIIIAKQIDRNNLKITNFEMENNRRNSMNIISNAAAAVNSNIKNTYTNAAERLFTEIIIKSAVADEQEYLQKNHKNYETKLEHCIQVRTPSPPSVNKINCLFNSSGSGSSSSSSSNHMENNVVNVSDVQTITNEVNNDKVTQKKVTFHEMLISELAAMHKNDDEQSMVSNVVEQLPSVEQQRKRIPSICSTDSSPNGTRKSRIRTADWVEVGDNGKEVLLSSCQISLEDSGLEDDEQRLDEVSSSGVGDSWDSVKDIEERMSLPGLPPLPKSLSGLELNNGHTNNNTGIMPIDIQRIATPTSIERKPSTLDTQLAILRREMFGLRQLDLSLLSQLWALNESIQEFRTIIQEQEELSPHSPSPSPSDTNSISSSDEGENHIATIQQYQQLQQQHQQQQQQQQQLNQSQPSQQRMRSAPPPPPPSRKAPARPV